MIAVLLALAVQGADTVIPEDSLDAPPVIQQAPQLSYPIDLLQSGKQARVIVQFVLDTTGHAERKSIRVVSAPYRGFSLPAKAFVRDAVFTPGVFHGRKVRVLMRYPVEFRIHGGS
jgi:TonB family protein